MGSKNVQAAAYNGARTVPNPLIMRKHIIFIKNSVLLCISKKSVNPTFCLLLFILVRLLGSVKYTSKCITTHFVGVDLA